MSPRQYLGALPRSGSGTAGQLEVVASPSGPCAVGAVVFDSDALVMRLCATGQWERVLVDDGTRRAWSDGTYAATCEAYRRPPAGYAYAGSTGSGLYAIDPDGDGAPMTVYCDQVTEDGGWTRVVNAVPVGSWSEVRVTQATVLAGTADKARVDTANGWIGLDRWPLLGDELLEKCSGGTAGTHAAYGAFSINPASNWSVNWTIGGNWASLHNNRGLSTTDYDRDIWNDPCVTYTGHESSGWGWHASCHIGSFWFGSNGLNICHVNPGATHTGTTSESTHVEWFLR